MLFVGFLGCGWLKGHGKKRWWGEVGREGVGYV